MTKTTRIVCLCILGAVGTLCGVSTINAPITEDKTELITPTEPHMGNAQPRLGIKNNTRTPKAGRELFQTTFRYRKQYPAIRVGTKNSHK